VRNARIFERDSSLSLSGGPYRLGHSPQWLTGSINGGGLRSWPMSWTVPVRNATSLNVDRTGRVRVRDAAVCEAGHPGPAPPSPSPSRAPGCKLPRNLPGAQVNYPEPQEWHDHPARNPQAARRALPAGPQGPPESPTVTATRRGGRERSRPGGHARTPPSSGVELEMGRDSSRFESNRDRENPGYFPGQIGTGRDGDFGDFGVWVGPMVQLKFGPSGGCSVALELPGPGPAPALRCEVEGAAYHRQWPSPVNRPAGRASRVTG
jgi:hypothetical protein